MSSKEVPNQVGREAFLANLGLQDIQGLQTLDLAPSNQGSGLANQ